MIRVGKNNYPTTFIDTDDTIKNLIASENDTLPTFVRILDAERAELLSTRLPKIPVAELQATSKEWGIDINDLVMEWLYLKHGKGVNRNNLTLIEALRKIDSTSYWSADAINNLLINYAGLRKDLMAKLAETVKKEAEYRKKYKKYKPVATTRFIQDSVIIDYKLAFNERSVALGVDPLELFNKLVLSSIVPFVQARIGGVEYYKVHSSLTLSQKLLAEWTDQPFAASGFLFKIHASATSGEWGTATLIGDTLTVESAIGPGENSEQALQASLFAVLQVPVTVVSRTEKGVKGVFAVPHVTISRDIFLDAITNEPIISHYLYVDETRELSSQKSVLYVYSASGTDEPLTVFISEKISSRSDLFYTQQELPLHTQYLNVRVSRATSLFQITRFMQAFAVILDLYSDLAPKITAEYEKLIPELRIGGGGKKSTRQEGKKLWALQEMAPDLFIQGYPTKCEPKKQPIPIEKTEIKKYIKDGYEVMNYPLESANYFVCDKKDKWQYPGLLPNKMDNKEAYQYLPCCYTQTQLKGSHPRNIYEHGNVMAGKRLPTGNIVDKKAIELGKFGLLPRNIHELIAGADETFLRAGVPFGANAFIEAVLLAVDADYEQVPQDDRPAFVEHFREALVTINPAAYCQELFDKPAEAGLF